MSPANIWIKICGNTSLEDAPACRRGWCGCRRLRLRAQPAPRHTRTGCRHRAPSARNSGKNRRLRRCHRLRRSKSTVNTSGLTGVQLHFDAAPDLSAQLRAHFGPDAPHPARNPLQPEAAEAATAIVMQRPQCGRGDDRFPHSHSRRRHRPSFDWALASKTLFQNTEAYEACRRRRSDPGKRSRGHRTLSPLGRRRGLRRRSRAGPQGPRQGTGFHCQRPSGIPLLSSRCSQAAR